MNKTYLHEPDAWLGTWINPATKCYHLDITTIYPTLEEAKQEAFERGMQESRNVVAIYNFKQEHRLCIYRYTACVP